jgi:phage terminase large subunit GpA-like protein
MGARDDRMVALADVCSGWQSLMPPNRVRVSEGAADILKIGRPGSAPMNWSPTETPYMVEPIDVLSSRILMATCFVGPSQSGKTVGLGEGWLAHNVVNDPGDMAIFQMTQDKAREYSGQRVDRAILNSDKLREMLSARSRDDNIHDKAFKNGMRLKIAWPTATNMSSTSYRYCFGTDYDRWNGGKDDVDGEGDGFSLMRARTKTFMSRGMTAVESSPGRARVDPGWKPATLHEAPPVGTPEIGTGILGIYNLGDRRRWYWKCPHCGFRFEAEPGLRLFGLDSDDQLIEDIRDINIDAYARQHARIACADCGAVLTQADRTGMNERGIWLPDGLTIDDLDRISGNARVSDIASFWLGGIAATYQPWRTLIEHHLNGLYEFAMTGNELTLQTAANTEQGVPYMSQYLRDAEHAAKRGRVVEHDLQRYIVPDWARFVVVVVDVQGGKSARFVVQVHAIGEHQRQAVIDRYVITESAREGMGDKFAPIDPASHPEDWDVLTDKCLRATYRLADGRELRVKVVGVDTGGEGMKGLPENVTNNAYAWSRRVRKLGLRARLRLLKGVGIKPGSPGNTWHVKETKVGGKQGKGDVPLWLLNTNLLKDIVHAGLQRRVVGPNYYHFPEPRSEKNPNGWVTQAFFDELHAEVRNDNGVWEQIKRRNETFDCCQMARGLCLMLGVDRSTFWSSPPAWALPFDQGNSEIVSAEQRREEKAEPLPAVEAVEVVAPVRPKVTQPAPKPTYQRRVASSPYLG